MALTLIVETGAGLADANVYASLAETDAWYEARPYAALWYPLDPERKKRALLWSTQLIDIHVTFHGEPATDAQALRCPRRGLVDRDGRAIASTVLPPEVKRATMELARWVDATDRTADSDTAGYSAITIGPLSLTVDPTDRLAVLPSIVADMLTPYGVVRRSTQPSMAQLVRV